MLSLQQGLLGAASCWGWFSAAEPVGLVSVGAEADLQNGHLNYFISILKTTKIQILTNYNKPTNPKPAKKAQGWRQFIFMFT